MGLPIRRYRNAHDVPRPQFSNVELYLADLPTSVVRTWRVLVREDHHLFPQVRHVAQPWPPVNDVRPEILPVRVEDQSPYFSSSIGLWLIPIQFRDEELHQVGLSIARSCEGDRSPSHQTLDIEGHGELGVHRLEDWARLGYSGAAKNELPKNECTEFS